MRKWEYGSSQITITKKAQEEFGRDANTLLVEQLNALGNEGWEVVSLSKRGDTTTVYTKRPVTEIAGKKVEPLRKSSQEKPLIVELAVTQLAAGAADFGRQKCNITVQCPEIEFKKDYEYTYQWTASMAQQSNQPQIKMEQVQAFAESELRKDLEQLGHNPSQLRFV